MKSCKNCVHWKSEDNKEGLCKGRATTLSFMSMWLVTDHDFYCDEYEEKKLEKK
jgi:hypothetical protein